MNFTMILLSLSIIIGAVISCSRVNTIMRRAEQEKFETNTRLIKILDTYIKECGNENP